MRQRPLSSMIFNEAMRPDRVIVAEHIQIDCERIRILGDGSIDENYEHEGLHLAANRMWPLEANPKSSGNVVDAIARFEERQWDQRHPKLSDPALKRILNALLK